MQRVQSLATRKLRSEPSLFPRGNELLDFLTYKMEEIEEEGSNDQGSLSTSTINDFEITMPKPGSLVLRTLHSEPNEDCDATAL